jgi:hypothetical protein
MRPFLVCIHDATPAFARETRVMIRDLAPLLIRTVPEQRAEIPRLILDVYADEGVTCLLAMSFAPALRRPLSFHLAQAALSFHGFREIGRLLRERLAE